MAKGTGNVIRFRKNDHIGFADAEADEDFLTNCFVETDDLKVLRDCNDPRCIVIGRTGSGKTALLKRLQAVEENCSELSPEILALNYISNSNVIEFFESVGVNLDPFYKLLWNHVLAIELIRGRFHITNEETRKTFLSFVANAIRRDKRKEQAIRYLETWGDSFWEETEIRIRQLTEKIEEQFKASAGSKSAIVSLGAEGAKNLSAEEKYEIKQRGREVVNSVQIRDLLTVIDILADDIFRDSKKSFYIIIDKLDEGWVDDKVRYRLIKALIESIRQFRKVTHTKIVIALRTDLKNRMITETDRVPRSGVRAAGSP